MMKILFILLLFCSPTIAYSQPSIKYDENLGERLDSLFNENYQQEYSEIVEILDDAGISTEDRNFGYLLIKESRIEEDSIRGILSQAYWCDCLLYKNHLNFSSGLGMQNGYEVVLSGNYADEDYIASLGLYFAEKKEFEVDLSREMLNEIEFVLENATIVFSNRNISKREPYIDWQITGSTNTFREKNEDGLWSEKKLIVDVHFRCKVETF